MQQKRTYRDDESEIHETRYMPSKTHSLSMRQFILLEAFNDVCGFGNDLAGYSVGKLPGWCYLVSSNARWILSSNTA